MAASMSCLVQTKYPPLHTHQSLFVSLLAATAALLPTLTYAVYPDCDVVNHLPGPNTLMMKANCSDVAYRGSYNQRDHCHFFNGVGGSHADSDYYPNQASHSLNINFASVDKALYFIFIRTDGSFENVYAVPQGVTCYVGVQQAPLGVKDIITWPQ
jgi:hypothetical protein